MNSKAIIYIYKSSYKWQIEHLLALVRLTDYNKEYF